MKALNYTKQDQPNFGQLDSIRIKSLFLSTFVSFLNKKLSKNLSKALLDCSEDNYRTGMNPVTLL